MKKIIVLFLTLISINSFGLEDYKVSVSGMVCSFCANGIEKQLKEVEDIIAVNVNLDKFLVNIQSRKILDEELIRKKIVDAGYKVDKIERVVNEKMDK